MKRLAKPKQCGGQGKRPSLCTFASAIESISLISRSRGTRTRKKPGRRSKTLWRNWLVAKQQIEPIKSQQQKGQQAQRRQALPRKPSVTAPRTSRLLRPVKRRQGDGRIIPGGVRMRKHYNKWQRLRRKRWDRLLNNKRDAESVAEGAAETHPTTQRLISAPMMRKGRRILRGQ